MARKTAKTARKRKPGRPSKYSPEVIEAICARLSKGEPLAAICREDGMPGRTTLWEWEQADKAISERIARAREEGEEAIAADCLLIADDAAGDFRMGEKSVLADTDHIQRSKLRIETRLKLLAKWNPGKWGDKLQTEHSGSLTIERRVFPAEPE